MAGERKVLHKHTQPVILDADMLEDFKKAIKQDISGYFRQIQYDVVEAYRNEQKKVTPPAKGAILNYVNDRYKGFIHKDKQQSTLDIFAKVPEINTFLHDTNDINKLGQIRRNAHLIESIAKTKIIKIGKGTI